MEKGEQIRYSAVLIHETTDKAEHEKFLKVATKLGGVPLSSEAVIERIQESGPYDLNREDINSILDRRKISDAWKTRYWKALTDIQSEKEYPEISHYRDHPKIINIDIRLIRERLEETERGRTMPSGIGQKIWDILSDTINERYPDDPEIRPLLHWDPLIHPRLENLSKGQELIDILAGRYSS